jgi:hypothetical protein
MSDVKETIAKKKEELQKERTQVANSLQFFKQNFEQAQIRIIQLDSQIDVLTKVLAGKEQLEEVPEKVEEKK